MEALELLQRAQREFARRVARVRPSDLSLPTPCPEWDVAALIRHVVGADRAYVAIMRGGSVEDFARVASATDLSERPAADFEASSAELLEEMGRPSELDRIVHHPIGDIPVLQLLGMRVTDWTVHGWDLARAIGGEERIDPGLAEALLKRTQARGDALYATGYFRRGPGVPGNASPQAQLLDLLGRDPAPLATSGRRHGHAAR
jgi:uncharacterized protein (TIGR03086 family)